MAHRPLFLSLSLFISLYFAPLAALAGDSEELFAHIKPYAELANASYLSQQQIQAIVETRGHSLSEFASVPGVQVSYFVATDDTHKRQVIAVRGTANLENAIVDISLKLLPDKHAGIALHQGFAQAAEAIYRALKPVIHKDYEISVTGHSLGGAIAVILAMYLDIDDYSLGSIITFGQPKVTNVSGARAFAHLPVTRVVTEQDLVPLAPPLDAMDINNLDIYWHLGSEIVLLQGDDYAVLDGIKSMMRATRVFNKIPDQQNLQHHQMALYLSLIEHRTQQARLAPYETRIDLFKLFNSLIPGPEDSTTQ